MKRMLMMATLLVLAVSAYAQEDVTKFLGIPVDGTKSAMVQKLKAKGFTYNSTYDNLEGEFNGVDVFVSVATNNNKVYRIVVIDANSSNETDIKIRFNKLCGQFERNPKYVGLSESQAISDDEDISYEMLVHSKRYEAGYCQVDTAAVSAEMQRYLSSRYTQEQLENYTSIIRKTNCTKFPKRDVQNLRFFARPVRFKRHLNAHRMTTAPRGCLYNFSTGRTPSWLSSRGC